MQAVDLEDVSAAIFYVLAACHRQGLRQIGELSKPQETILDALALEIKAMPEGLSLEAEAERLFSAFLKIRNQLKKETE